MSVADPTNPSDMLGTTQTKLPAEREFVIKRPGNINVAGDRGNYPGCRLVCFTSMGAEGMEPEDAALFIQQMDADLKTTKCTLTASGAANLYFKHRANMLVVDQTVDQNGNVWVWVTNQLEDEALEDFLEFSNDWEEFSGKRRAEREVRRKAAEAAKQEKVNEEKALAELGRKARDHNLLGKLKELEDELAAARKELNKLKKATK